jgi:hypothetical protein
MSTQDKAVDASERTGEWACRVGGICALLVVLGYLLTFPVFGAVGVWPGGAEARLGYFGKHSTGWWTITGLMVVTDLLWVPVWLALYQVLKGINKYLTLLAVACGFLFVALDLAVTWTAHSSLLTLGSTYAAATSDAQRAAIVAAAGYASSLLDSPLLAVYIILIPSIGVLLASLVMARTVFGKPTAYLGWAVGVSGIAAGIGPLFTRALGAAPVVNALLVMVWFFLAGWRLLRRGR